MKMTYKNSFGTVDIFGEGSDGFGILDLDGVGVPGRERGLIKFAGVDGYEEGIASFGQRVITVSGDIPCREEEKVQNAVKVFSAPGTLIIEAHGIKRQISVNDAVFTLTCKNKMYKGFCVQMTCDKPHFTDCTDISREVYSKEKLITSETVLPAMFTRRSFGGNVANDGAVRVEPIVMIKSTADADENGTIRIENNTTGKYIVLNHSLSEGEIITVNIPERTVISSISGDILNTLDTDSFLYDIYLECGDNEIDVLVSDENRSCEIYITYRNLYTGMVI